MTLVVYDCVAHELTRFALEESLNQIDPKAVHIWTNKPKFFFGLGQVFETKTSKELLEAEEVLWYQAPAKLTTSHVLVVQWDGWVLNGNLWKDEFLAYDYIGAPWPWHLHDRVGNGGFSLRSTRLMKLLADKSSPFPLKMPSDEVICRRYRGALEMFGFKWPPESLASEFSLEHGEMRSTFGFHDLQNWTRLLPQSKVQQLVALANDYVRQKPGYQEMANSFLETAS